MTREQRHGWLIVAVLFVVEMLVLGGITGTMGLFLTPLMKQFGWSHSRVSMLPTAFSLAFGLGTPLVGSLMDRIDARFIMSWGAAMGGLGLLIASQTPSFEIFFAAFLAIGLGTCASTFVPAAIVVANWFTDNRGFATGAAMMGSSVGTILMPLLAAHLLSARGVSFTYEVLSTLALLNIIPLFAIVRTRPGDTRSSVSETAQSLPGLEVGQALKTSSFWLLALIQTLLLGGEAGVFFHLGSFLAGAGFSPQQTAMVYSGTAVAGIFGMMLIGALADRFTARRVLPFVILPLAASVIVLLGSHGTNPILWVCGYVILYGLAGGVAVSLTPVVLVEALGLRRFGSLSGLVGLVATAGTGGPLLVGALYDATSSYTVSYEVCAAAFLLSAFAAIFIVPMEGVETARVSTHGA